MKGKITIHFTVVDDEKRYSLSHAVSGESVDTSALQRICENMIDKVLKERTRRKKIRIVK